ncbi:glycosyltransferase [Mesorhizobium sp. ZMM04-5]|uniref:Glycosyltransferase n=1 Tax=Mesorhizobium marinum TaxID=3228790 RepID=A0ABV3QZE3_9HYPH
MTDELLRIAFGHRAVASTEAIGTTLAVSDAALQADASIVIDVYDLDHPVHPAGHLGWWKFRMAAASPVDIRLRVDASAVEATLANEPPTQLWLNPAPPQYRRLLLNAVVRSNTTNAILALDRIAAVPGEDALVEFRAAFDRDWSSPRLAPSPYIPDPGQTIHIVSRAIFQRDAVGELCLDLYRMLRQNRIPVRMHAEGCDLTINDIVEPQNLLHERIGPADQVLYFYSQHDPLLEPLLAADCARKCVYFHGITDPDLVRVFDPELSVVCAKAIAELPRLARFDRFAANSRHSASALARALGPERAPDIGVIPPQIAPRPAARHEDSAPRQDALLSVQQMRPHKKVEDVLRLFAAYREASPSAQCWIVGRAPNRAYRDYLDWVERKELGLPAGAVRWLGSVGPAELADLYRSASAYVSMSEDEGFCLPLFEAMRNGLPVFAYGVPAVAETLGGSGLRFATKDFPHLAEHLAAVLADPARRSALLAGQARRVDDLLPRMSGTGFFELLSP